MIGNMNAIVFDFVARSKIHSTTVNWYLFEQLPVVPLERYDSVGFGRRTAGAIVRDAVLELTYTAHDLAPFARDAGYIDNVAGVKPPFAWPNLNTDLDKYSIFQQVIASRLVLSTTGVVWIGSGGGLRV
jgi:hypothetical protein